jgi:DNA-directed RNA polymerase sigma subunit (sigma70/sigma32)
MDKDPRPIRSYAEVGKIVGLTRQRVYQYEQMALRKLKRHPIIVKLAKEMGLLPEDEE